MTMDMLKSGQENLCVWLSSDPDHILDQCGNILLMNEYKEVQKQKNSLDKIEKLFELIIDKGEKNCEDFIDILKRNKEHYPDLQEFFNPTINGSALPTVFAGDGSVVMARQITKTKIKSLSTRIEIGLKPEGDSPRNSVRPRADYFADSSSVVCADRISDTSIDGDVDVFISIKPIEPNSDEGKDSVSSPHGPAVSWIIDHKVKLISCLMADLWILQFVHEREVVTYNQYERLKHSSHPEKTVTDLIDQVVGKGQEACEKFLQILKEPEVQETYPQLKNFGIPDAW